MKIYFSASIDGAKGDDEFNSAVISHLKRYGPVLSELFFSKDRRNTENLSVREIHDQDLEWVEEADLIVAEVSAPSLGVGYEIKHALHKGKKVLCLWKKIDQKRLSMMISGAPGVYVINYDNKEHALKEIDNFFLQYND